MRILPFLFLLFSSLIVHGQNKTIDSLANLLTRKDIDQVKILLELARENNISGNYQAAVHYAESALDIATKQNDSLRIVMSYRLKGAALRRMERFDEALVFAGKAIAIARRNNFKSEIKFLLNTIAIIYTNKGSYDRALDYHLQSLVLREEEGDQYEISVSLNNIGSVYYKLENFKKAHEYFSRSFKVSKAIGETYDLELTLINIGLSEVYLMEFNQAINHIKEAFALCGGKCTDDIRIQGNFGLGVAYFNLDELQLAREYFNTSHQLAVTKGNKLYQAENLLLLSRIDIKTGSLQLAEKKIDQAELIADSYGYKHLLVDIYKEQYNLHTLKKETKENYYMKRYLALKDSLVSMDIASNITMIQSRFEEGQNMKSIDEQDNLIDVKQAAVEKFEIEYSVILMITAVCIALTVALVLFNRK